MKNKIKVGLWGLGRAGWNMHCEEIAKFNDEFELVAGCDLLPDRCREFEERYRRPAYPAEQAFLNDSEIELVSIATYSQDHVKDTRLALEHGKLVFLEKPVALSVAEGEELRRLDRQYPNRLFIRQNRRFEAAFQHVLEIMRRGILGNVYEIKLCRHNFMRRDDWQTLVNCGGGQLNNWGPHLIDHGLRFLESPCVEIHSDLKLIAACGDAEDHLKILLKGANGRVIDIEISGGVAIPGDVYQVYGTRGTLVSRDEKELVLKYLDPAVTLPALRPHAGSPARNSGYGDPGELKWLEETIPTRPANGYDMSDIYHYLYLALRENQPFPVTLEEALEVVRVTAEVKRQSAVERMR